MVFIDLAEPYNESIEKKQLGLPALVNLFATINKTTSKSEVARMSQDTAGELVKERIGKVTRYNVND